MLNYMCVKCEIRDRIASSQDLRCQRLYDDIENYLIQLNEKEKIEKREKIAIYRDMYHFNDKMVDRIKLMNRIMMIDESKITCLSEMAYEIYRVFLIHEKLSDLDSSQLNEQAVKQEIEKLFNIGI